MHNISAPSSLSLRLGKDNGRVVDGYYASGRSKFNNLSNLIRLG